MDIDHSNWDHNQTLMDLKSTIDLIRLWNWSYWTWTLTLRIPQSSLYWSDHKSYDTHIQLTTPASEICKNTNNHTSRSWAGITMSERRLLVICVSSLKTTESNCGQHDVLLSPFPECYLPVHSTLITNLQERWPRFLLLHLFRRGPHREDGSWNIRSDHRQI